MITKVTKEQFIVIPPLVKMISVVSPVTLWWFGPGIEHWVPHGEPLVFSAQFINTRYEGCKSGEVEQKPADKKCRIRPKVK